jgi:hypothetical protein
LPQSLHRSRANAARLSGAEAFAAAGAASGNDLAAALGRHAGAKTVTALPHELARLIGPFHGSDLRWSRRNAGWCRVPPPGLVSPAYLQGHRRQIHAAYKGGRPLSSMQRRALTLINGALAAFRDPAGSRLASKNSDMSPHARSCIDRCDFRFRDDTFARGSDRRAGPEGRQSFCGSGWTGR